MLKVLFMLGKDPSKSLRDAKIASSKRSSQSSSSGKENLEAGPGSNKWRCSVPDTGDVVSKKMGKDSEVPNGLQEARQDLQDESVDPCQTNRYRSNLPYTLIRLMYQLDLSVLCSLRKMRYEHKYPSLSLAFEDLEIHKFNNIVLRHKGKSIHVQIEIVDKYYTNNDISYAGLFAKKEEKQSFCINNYFDGFVKSLISKLDSSSSNIEYLIIYTNAGLDLTKEKKLKEDGSSNFYPFKFDSMNMEECEMLKDFLFANDNAQGLGFYQFSRDKTIRRELLTRIGFAPAMWKALKKRNLPEKFEKQIKREFLNKLVFAVNQPSREELNSIIRSEMKENGGVQDNYIILRERILSNLAAPRKHKELGSYVPRITYEFNLLMFFLHDMFLDKNMFSINFEEKSYDISNNISINYRDRITYVKAHNADSDIGYSELFPSGHHREKDMFSINKHFALFVEGSENDTKYFIIYTNADLNLTKEKRLKKKGKSRDFHPLKFDSLDIQKKRYKVLRNCSCISENGLYRFAKEEATREKVLGLLKLPSFLQKEKEKGRRFDGNEEEIKEKFLDSLIFAIKQHDKKELNSLIRNEIDKANVPYNHEELREIALRWLESREFGHITKGIMEKLLEDIKNNRPSYQKIQDEDINEEIKCAKYVVGRQGTPTFYQFLDFLIKGEGKIYLGVLKRQRIRLINMCSILGRAENNAVEAFKGLYDLWFDAKGNKTQYLKTLEKEGINLTSMSGILNQAGNNAVEAFKGLYDLWFDEKGNKTQYLETLEKEGIHLANVSNILYRAGCNAVTAFKGLYDLWFDDNGNKTQYLKTLEKEGINLANMSRILNGSGNNAVEAFKGLYDLWFDAEGNKTQYLKTLEKEGISLTNISFILYGAGNNAVTAFKELYNTFFDEQGNKNLHLKHFIEEKESNSFTLHNLSDILNGVGGNPQDAFEKLHSVCFNDDGKRAKLLDDFYKADFKASHISSVLWGTGSHAASALKRLHSIWLDNEGKRTKLVDDFYEIGFTPGNLCHILSGAGGNLEMFHDFCFVGETKKYLNHFLNETGFTPNHLCRILHTAKANVCSAFKDFYSVCFDDAGNKTQLLDDFYKAGFTANDLSRILHMTGNNAAFILRNFHKSCFNKKNYLNHFLAEKELFTPSDLCKILHGIRINTCTTFIKLHNLCFNKAGQKTEYLNNLIKNDRRKICVILREKVKVSS
ncbi:uncharacterized protein LOC143373327 isoform X2 [Andrena cerasifolii]|uniref:uncharacterized protein LOC143373327 isoform X2 n=1 Tax=Andrena cerasifolii TaxID=2819439 RepID=UPI004037F6EB